MSAKPFIVLFRIYWKIAKHKKNTYWNSKHHFEFFCCGFGSLNLKTSQSYLPGCGSREMLWSEDGKLVVREQLENHRVWIQVCCCLYSLWDIDVCFFSFIERSMWGLSDRWGIFTCTLECFHRPRYVQVALKGALVSAPMTLSSRKRILDTQKKWGK